MLEDVFLPVRLHEPEEIHRNLLRLAGYEALVLDEPPVEAPEAFFRDPEVCAELFLRGLGGVFERLGSSPALGEGVGSGPDRLVWLLALLARMPYVHCPVHEALFRFRLQLKGALVTASPEPWSFAELRARLRGRARHLVGRLQEDPDEPGVLPLSLEMSVRLYYLADALELFSLLQPPWGPHEHQHRSAGGRPPARRRRDPAQDPGAAPPAGAHLRRAGGPAPDGPGGGG